MKRIPILRYLPAFLLISAMVLLIAEPQIASAAVCAGLQLCAAVLIPSLFPFFVCTNLITELGYAQAVASPAGPFTQKLFGVSGAGATALLLGLVGGYPSGAQVCANLYTSGAVSKKEAEQLALFCSNAGPAFVFGVMGARVFASVRAGILLYASQILSAIALGALLKKDGMNTGSGRIKAQPEKSFSEAFTSSVKNAGQSALHITMFVTIFSVIAAFLASPFKTLFADAVFPLVTGILELSAGSAALQAAPYPCTLKLAAAAFLLAFSGLSVLAQTVCVLSQAGLRAKGLLGAKLLQGLLAAAIILLLSLLFPLAERTAAFSVSQSRSAFAGIAAVSVFSAIFCCIFLKMISGNRRKNHV